MCSWSTFLYERERAQHFLFFLFDLEGKLLLTVWSAVVRTSLDSFLWSALNRQLTGQEKKENVNCGPSASADYYLGPQCDHVFFDPARFHFFFLLRSPILFFSLMWAIICKRKRMTRSLDPFLDDSFRLAIC